MADTVLLQGWHRCSRIYTNSWMAPVHAMADTIVLGTVVHEFTGIYGWHMFTLWLTPLLSAPLFSNLWLAPRNYGWHLFTL